MKRQIFALIAGVIGATGANSLLSRITLESPKTMCKSEQNKPMFIDKKAAHACAREQYQALITDNKLIPTVIKNKCNERALLDEISILYEQAAETKIDEAIVLAKIWEVLQTMIHNAQLFKIPRDVLFAQVMLNKEQAQRLMREEFNRWITINNDISDNIKETFTFRPLLEVIESYYTTSQECDLGCLTLSLWDKIEEMVNSVQS